MKKTLYFLFLLVGLFAYAQSGPNPFAEKESESAFNKDGAVKENDKDIPQKDTGGGNPGDPVPIDNYIPILILTAVGIIVYQTRKEKNFNS